jgi:5-methylthioadenosine/S-adenosylhomocysteine deaminase
MTLDLAIKDALNLEGKTISLGIKGNRIASVSEKPSTDPARKTISGKDKLILPAFVNAHTHAAMTLFRGAGDDMPLKQWLEEKIFPREAKLTSDAVYWGTRLACAEMIRSGVTTFNDMYFHMASVGHALRDSGMRGIVGQVVMSRAVPGVDFRAKTEALFAQYASGVFGPRVKLAVCPHAPYSVDPAEMQWVAAFAKQNQLMVHIHLAENEWEVTQSLAEYGLRPAAWLAEMGVFENPTLCAHSVWLNDEDRALLAAWGATVVHCPVSNLKLVSGGDKQKFFEAQAALTSGINVALATDGVASNNNFDFFGEMKMAALVAKHQAGNPAALPAEQVLTMATLGGARALGYTDLGKIEVGALADLILVDTNRPEFFPPENWASHLVYAATPECVTHTICDGQVLMEDRQISGWEEIKREYVRVWRDLVYT